MSKVGNNPIMATVNGKLGDVVVYRKVRGELVMCKPPRKRSVLTSSQADKKERFMEAVAYAKAMMADAASKAEYESGITTRLTSAYSVAVTDYLKAPEIKSVDTSEYVGAIGDVLAIKATDDFKVTSVKVDIRDAANNLIERGDAVLQANSQTVWLYTVTVANPALAGTRIIIKVKDKPGNTAMVEQIL